jgi:hypothetical protein
MSRHYADRRRASQTLYVDMVSVTCLVYYDIHRRALSPHGLLRTFRITMRSQPKRCRPRGRSNVCQVVKSKLKVFSIFISVLVRARFWQDDDSTLSSSRRCWSEARSCGTSHLDCNPNFSPAASVLCSCKLPSTASSASLAALTNVSYLGSDDIASDSLKHDGCGLYSRACPATPCRPLVA